LVERRKPTVFCAASAETDRYFGCQNQQAQIRRFPPLCGTCSGAVSSEPLARYAKGLPKLDGSGLDPRMTTCHLAGGI
jgi:hypothetical protein